MLASTSAVMQSFATTAARRSYHTTAVLAARLKPDSRLVARTQSTPRAVRNRRQAPGDFVKPENDATANGLSPSERTRYERHRAMGDLTGTDGRDMSDIDWLSRLNDRRTRIRGIQGKGEGVEVVGQRIYLPNIIFRLVRNQTKPGQPYNPYEATFRIPQSVTKTDVRSYLHAVYGIATTYIRTDNYFSSVKRAVDLSMSRTNSRKTYKRAVVGLVEPFYYPQALEDMPKEDREKRTEYLETKFAIQGIRNLQKAELLRMTRSNAPGWKWRHGITANRGKIIQRIMERRTTRDLAVEDGAVRLQKARLSPANKTKSAVKELVAQPTVSGEKATVVD